MANPYAPPGQDDGGYVPPPGAGALGAPQPWEIGEVCRLGWEVVKREPMLIVAELIVVIIPNTLSSISSVVEAVGILEAGSAAALALRGVLTLVSVVIGWFFQVGIVRMFLAAVRGQQAPLSLLFSGADRFLSMFGMLFVTGMVVGIGTLLLIVPGVIAYVGLWLGKFYLLDRRQGAIESLQSSWEITKGNRLDLFLFSLVYFALAMGGVCLCGIGILVTIPIGEAALTIIYLRRTGQASGPIGPGGGVVVPAGGYGAPPGGGYGAPPGGGYAPPGGGYVPPGGGYAPPGGYGPPPGGGGYPPR